MAAPDEVIRDDDPQAAPTGLAAFGYHQELRRSLGLVDLVIYGLLFISPTAPFPTFGIVFNDSHGLVPLVYAVGLAAMLFTALSYMAMAHEFPVSGSVYAYAGRGIGEGAGFLAGWAMLLDYALIPAGIYIICAVALNVVLPGVPKALWVVALLALNTVINLAGIETAARMNWALLTLQLLLLGAFFVLGAIALAHGAGGAHLSARPLWSAGVSPALIFSAMPVAALSFLGFDAVSTLSEEARGGPRAVGAATMLALVVAAVLFIAQTWLGSLFVLDVSRFAPGKPTDTAFYEVVKLVGGEPFKWVVSIFGVLFGGVSAALVSQAGASRLIYSMARDRRLPSALAKVHPARQVPVRAILLVAAVTLVLGVSFVDQLELILTVVSIGALTGFMLLHASVISHFFLRKRTGDWRRHLLVPLLGLAIIAYVLVSAKANAKIVGASWMGLGAAVMLALRATGRLRPLGAGSAAP
ncbi:MAG TPA: APC family permease [Caulobacteraceae bacterium]|nr:APC family permease [Caulobacteraceae bacterium]